MDKLKEMLKTLNFSEKSKKIIVEAYTLEKALAEGCKKLHASINEVEYEILDYGSTGFLGLNKKPYKILIYKVSKVVEERLEEKGIEEGVKVEEILDPDGKFSVILGKDGVLLKVTAPKKREGKSVKFNEVINVIKTKNVLNYNEKFIKKVVEEAKGEYVKIGTYNGLYEASSTFQIRLSHDEMSASVIAFPPKARGFELTYDEIIDGLKSNGVIEGILKEEIEKLVDEKIYYQDVIVAKGKKPVNGENAQFVYYFDINSDTNTYKEIIEKGRFDFKLINKKIQNVLKNDLLVEKKPFSEGEPGYTVTGKILPAKPGQDKQIPAGENTILSPDGLQLRAAIDGQVIKKGNKICVEPVKHIQGDVDIKVGNIVFVGSVVVHGSVQDGFSIKCKGTIEVRGSVGKCTLISDSDIYIAEGIHGQDEAEIITEGSVFAKFIENAKVSAGKFVIVDDHIGHSNVDANEYIVLFGRRAQLYGGIIRCGVEVNCKTLGNISYSDTIVEVGVLPELRREHEKLINEKKKLEEEISTLKLDISTLEDLRKNRAKWNEEKHNLY